jgi:hypothetical protein
MAPGLPIHISRSPHNVKLLVWGRAADGWWGNGDPWYAMMAANKIATLQLR